MRRKFLVTVASTAVLCFAQPDIASEQQEVRRVVEQFMKAARTSDRAGVAALSTKAAQFTSSGGTAAFGLPDRLPSWKHRSNMLRRIELLSPDTALAIGVWKDFDATQPFDTGTFEWTLVREGGNWKMRLAHEAFLPAPQVVSSLHAEGPAAGTVDADGREALFDGHTLSGWTGTDLSSGMERSWRIEDGALVAVVGGPRSSLMTLRQFLYFDLRFEWLAVAKSNSGVKYRLLGFDRILGRSAEALGFEYQVADDDGDPGARIDARQRSGALYSVTPVEHSAAKPLGQWNESRILVTAEGIQHWLNGTQTAKYATDIPFASSIVVQHHTTEVRFRNLRIRRLPDTQ